MCVKKKLPDALYLSGNTHTSLCVKLSMQLCVIKLSSPKIIMCFTRFLQTQMLTNLTAHFIACHTNMLVNTILLSCNYKCACTVHCALRTVAMPVYCALQSRSQYISVLCRHAKVALNDLNVSKQRAYLVWTYLLSCLDR